MYVPPELAKIEINSKYSPYILFAALNFYAGRAWHSSHRIYAEMITAFETIVFAAEFIKNPELLNEPSAYIPIAAAALFQGAGYLSARQKKEENLESKIDA